MKRAVKISYRLFFYWQWNIGIVSQPASKFLTSAEAAEVQWLDGLTRFKFWADPAVIKKDGKLYIFYEDYSFRTGRGVISVQVFKPEDGKFKAVSAHRDIIPADCHLSYPYLVRHDSKVYCIPETSRKNEVAIYEPEEFPFKWKKARVLIPDYAGVDNTVFWYNDKWWLFSTDLNDRIESRLKIFYADDLFGSWQPHLNNPAKDDITSSRPAGTPFEYQGALYRPAQDSSRVYGGRVVFNRITKLSPEVFQEETVKIIEPVKQSRFNQALHTVSSDGDITVIDGARQVCICKSLAALLYKVKRLLGVIRY